ncbi:MAG: hypothetical protein QOE92_2615 [Chloroflexota bacterium]|jgi:hypothetical protein|nr:hypothetical protein [Chloroflexota bacterium]
MAGGPHEAAKLYSNCTIGSAVEVCQTAPARSSYLTDFMYQSR